MHVPRCKWHLLCSVLQCVTMCCNVLQCVRSCWDTRSRIDSHFSSEASWPGSWRARRTDMAWQASNAISAISAIAFIMFEYAFMFVLKSERVTRFCWKFSSCLYPLRLKKVLRTSSGTKPCDPLCQGTWQNEYVQFESIWHHFTILDHRGPNFNAGISCRFWTSVKQTHLSSLITYTEIIYWNHNLQQFLNRARGQLAFSLTALNFSCKHLRSPSPEHVPCRTSLGGAGRHQQVPTAKSKC